MRSATVELQLLRAYNDQLRFWFPGSRGKTMSHKLRTSFKQFADWCEQQSVAPVDFLRARFHEVYVMRGQPVGVYTLRSTELLELDDDERPRWMRWLEELETVERDARATVVKAERPEPSPATESVRARYADGAQEICLTYSDFHGGYDSRSQHCVQCPAPTRAKCSGGRHGRGRSV